MLIHKVPSGFRCSFGIFRHERQLKHFHARKAPRRVAQHGEHEIVHALFHAIDELRRRAAAAHGGQGHAAHALIGFFGNRVAPRRDQLFHGERCLWPVMLEIQRDFGFGGCSVLGECTLEYTQRSQE